jgi:hypothetical protein
VLAFERPGGRPVRVLCPVAPSEHPLYGVFTMPNKEWWASRNMSDLLMLCIGKDCAREHPREFDDLVERARAGGCAVEFVRCQGSCTGPTAVLHDGERMRWFERLDGAKARRDVVALAGGTSVELSKRLAKRELTGTARDKARRRLAARPPRT